MSPAAKRPADSKKPTPKRGESPRRVVRVARELAKEAFISEEGRKINPASVQETQSAWTGFMRLFRSVGRTRLVDTLTSLAQRPTSDGSLRAMA